MQKDHRFFTVTADKADIRIDAYNVLYVVMDGNYAYLHTQSEAIRARITLEKLVPLLGENFIKVSRGCLVSVLAIHAVDEKINLSNGEMLDYSKKNKKEIIDLLAAKQRELIRSFSDSPLPVTPEHFRDYYRVFDHMPFAFCDIEMIFDSELRAVDWVFRYGNPALAELEKIPLDDLIGASFSHCFPNMDTKWLRTYERAALFGETLKIIDYSPEIDTYLDVICFPTFKGHCGCMLFDVSKLKSFRNTSDTEKALALFIGKLLSGNM